MIKLAIAGFPDGGRMPDKYACSLVSPAIQWSGAPATTKSYVLIMHDPDAVEPVMAGSPDGILHWGIFDIPGTAKGLPEGVRHAEQLPDGSRQMADFAPGPAGGPPPPPPPPAGSKGAEILKQVGEGPGYGGPCAPPGHGLHHYVFELYALNAKLGLPSNTSRQTLMNAMKGKVVARGMYVGMFGRN